jgi:hypothetical protein
VGEGLPQVSHVVFQFEPLRDIFRIVGYAGIIVGRDLPDDKLPTPDKSHYRTCEVLMDLLREVGGMKLVNFPQTRGKTSRQFCTSTAHVTTLQSG